MRVRPFFADPCELQVWLSEKASNYQLHVQRDGTVHTRCPFYSACATCQTPDNWPSILNRSRLFISFAGALFWPTRRPRSERMVLSRGRRGPLECTRGVSGLEGPPSSAALQRHLPGICWWGPNQELIENLDLRYDAIYLGADLAPHAIQKRGSRPGFLHSSTYGRRIRLTARTASTGSNFLHTPRSSSTKAFPTIRRTCWRK